MNNGRYCDNCGHHLSEEDYTKAFSWSYSCPHCDFEYSHSSQLTVEEQIEKFNEGDEE